MYIYTVYAFVIEQNYYTIIKIIIPINPMSGVNKYKKRLDSNTLLNYQISRKRVN